MRAMPIATQGNSVQACAVVCGPRSNSRGFVLAALTGVQSLSSCRKAASAALRARFTAASSSMSCRWGTRHDKAARIIIEANSNSDPDHAAHLDWTVTNPVTLQLPAHPHMASRRTGVCQV
jgi:hypothetical protein